MVLSTIALAKAMPMVMDDHYVPSDYYSTVFKKCLCAKSQDEVFRITGEFLSNHRNDP